MIYRLKKFFIRNLCCCKKKQNLEIDYDYFEDPCYDDDCVSNNTNNKKYAWI